MDVFIVKLNFLFYCDRRVHCWSTLLQEMVLYKGKDQLTFIKSLIQLIKIK